MKKINSGVIVLILTIWVTQIAAQAIPAKSLIGKWRTTSKQNVIEMNFVDSIHVTVNWKGFIKNASYTYNMGSDDENKPMLYMQDINDTVGNGRDMYLYWINASEIKINGLDLLWSRLRLYEDQRKNHSYILKRKK